MRAAEVAARQVKAERLAAVLLTHGADADTVAQLPARGWATVTRLAGTRAPSLVTQVLVVDLVRAARSLAITTAA